MGEEREMISGCPSCGARYKVPGRFHGKTLTCKKCSAPFTARTTPFPGLTGSHPESPDPCLVMGKLLVKYGYASEAQVREGFAFQAGEREEGREKRLGEILIEKGVISDNQLQRMISVRQALEERRLDAEFGAMAVQDGLARKEEVEKALEEQKRLFKERRGIKKIGDILVEAGIINQGQREAILERQKRLPADPEAPAADLEITVSKDALSAFVSLSGSDPDRRPPQVGEVKSALASRGVCYGIVDDSLLQSFLNGEQGKGPFMAAQGTAPVQGGGATIRYLFNTDPLRVGAIREGGSIDFRDRGPVVQVKKGDLLAEKVFAGEGEPGVDVFGKEIPPPAGKKINLRRGKRTVLSEDGMRLFADADGRPEIRGDGKIYVFAALEIDGDVDLKTGHLDFQGDILASGSVQNGFRVKGGSLTAGEILKAEIETVGDVAVFGGIIGATIRCGGHVRARYIHDADIRALGDVVVEKEIIDSSIETSGLCSTKKGHVLSCRIAAKKGVEAAQIGSDSSRPCILLVGTNEQAQSEIKRLRGSIQVKNEEKRKVNVRIRELDQESVKIHSQIGVMAQEQDCALVEKRGLSASADERFKTLEQEIAGRDKALEAQLETQESISEQLSRTQQELRRLDEEIAGVEEEIASISEWAKSEKGNPCVKVSGSIYQLTSIKGVHSSIILPETDSGVKISEIKVRSAGEQVEWKMKISRV